jgi:hypothetical protein
LGGKPKRRVMADSDEEEDDTRQLGGDAWQKQQQRRSEKAWIHKPSSGAQGRGIYVFDRWCDFRPKLELPSSGVPNFSMTMGGSRIDMSNNNTQSVVQEYILNPYLLGGYKFDLRLYVLVSSYWPLRAYIYEKGLVRFSTQKYDAMDLGNVFSHLCNTSLNKTSGDLDKVKDVVGKGCMWTLQRLWTYMKKEDKVDTDAVWREIKRICMMTLIPMVGEVPVEPHAFELYGFDIMLDHAATPYLVEVNRNSSMDITSYEHKVAKLPLLRDTCRLLGIDRRLLEPFCPYHDHGTEHLLREDEPELGGYEMIFPFSPLCQQASRDLVKVSYGSTHHNTAVRAFAQTVVKECRRVQRAEQQLKAEKEKELAEEAMERERERQRERAERM